MAGNGSLSLGPWPYTGEEKRLREQVNDLEERCARLAAALRLWEECGVPDKVSLYDEEGVEGWRWTAPDGTEWTEMGDWNEEPPMPPFARDALDA